MNRHANDEGSIDRSIDRWIAGSHSSGRINACSLLSFRRFNEQILGRILIAPDSARRQRANPCRRLSFRNWGETAVELETGENHFSRWRPRSTKISPPPPEIWLIKLFSLSPLVAPIFFRIFSPLVPRNKILDNTCTRNFFSSFSWEINPYGSLSSYSIR